MSKYANDVQTVSTPQTEPIRGKNMIKNRAGGYGFKVDDWKRLDRFLILGHEGGTYYATQRELSLETVDCIDRLLEVDAQRVVKTIVDVSLFGRAPKNDPAIFALAYVAKKGGVAGSLALSHLRDVCRTGTHLFDFMNVCKTLGKGWNYSMRRSVSQWYNRKPLSLAAQVTKYAQRNGWSHRDVLRQCHYRPPNSEINNVLKYVARHDEWTYSDSKGEVADFLRAVDEAKDEHTKPSRVIELIHQYGLVREHVNTLSLNQPAVWEALLENMPLTAMIRNLGKMTRIGLTVPFSAAANKVCQALADREALKSQRVHPVTLLIALRTYAKGKGIKGKLSWVAAPKIIDALDKAFYQAFDLIEPTGKNFMLGIDVSGSMNSCLCSGNGVLRCSEAAAAMAMVTARVEPENWIFGFSHEFRDLHVNAHDSLIDVLKKTQDSNFGGTDCALPIQYARKNNLNVDVFCIYTDCETWAGRGNAFYRVGTGYGKHNDSGHVCQELDGYRQKTGRPAKLAVFGLAQTDFTIEDPNDAGQMDFVGFDASAPAVLSEFVSWV